MGDSAVRLVFRDIVEAMHNNVPISHFSKEIDWLKARHEIGYAMNDVYINYLPQVDTTEGIFKTGDNNFSLFPLTSRAQLKSFPYDGVALGFIITPERDSLSGFLQYETAIVEADVAGAIKSSWIAALTE